MSRLIRPWLGASVNENTTGNISLTLEDAKESNAKTLATQQRTLDSLTEVVLDNTTALDYLCCGQHHLLHLG